MRQLWLSSMPTISWIAFLQSLSLSFMEDVAEGPVKDPERAKRLGNYKFYMKSGGPKDYLGRTVMLDPFFYGPHAYATIHKVIHPNLWEGFPDSQFKVRRDSSKVQYAVQRDNSNVPFDLVWGSNTTLINPPVEDKSAVQSKFVQIIRPTAFNHPKNGKALPPGQEVKIMALGYTYNCQMDKEEKAVDTCLVRVLEESRTLQDGIYQDSYAVMLDPRKDADRGEGSLLQAVLKRGDFRVLPKQPNLRVSTAAKQQLYKIGQLVRVVNPQTHNEDFNKFVRGPPAACAMVQSASPGEGDYWLVNFTWPGVLAGVFGQFNLETEVDDGRNPDPKTGRDCKAEEDFEKQRKEELDTEITMEPHEKGEPGLRKDLDYSELKNLKTSWQGELGELGNMINDKLQASAVHAINEHNNYVGNIWHMYDGVEHFNSALAKFRDESNVLDEQANEKLHFDYRKGYLEANLSNDIARKFNEYSHWRKHHMLQQHKKALQFHYKDHHKLTEAAPELKHLTPRERDAEKAKEEKIELGKYSGPGNLFYPEVPDDTNFMYFDDAKRGIDANAVNKFIMSFQDYNFGNVTCEDVTDLAKLITQFTEMVQHLVKMFPEVAKRRKLIHEYLKEYKTHPHHEELEGEFTTAAKLLQDDALKHTAVP